MAEDLMGKERKSIYTVLIRLNMLKKGEHPSPFSITYMWAYLQVEEVIYPPLPQIHVYFNLHRPESSLVIMPNSILSGAHS